MARITIQTIQHLRGIYEMQGEIREIFDWLLKELEETGYAILDTELAALVTLPDAELFDERRKQKESMKKATS